MSSNGVTSSDSSDLTTTAVRATVETKKSIMSNTSSSVTIPSYNSFNSEQTQKSTNHNYSPRSKETNRSQNLLNYDVTPPKPRGMTEAEKKVLLYKLRFFFYSKEYFVSFVG